MKRIFEGEEEEGREGEANRGISRNEEARGTGTRGQKRMGGQEEEKEGLGSELELCLVMDVARGGGAEARKADSWVGGLRLWD